MLQQKQKKLLTVMWWINFVTDLKKKVIREWADVHEEQQIVSLPVRSSEVLPSGGKKSTMVGFDEHLERIEDELTRGEPNLQILSIVGMGGIAFAQDGCPYPELEEIGENIVKSCNGLPLAIVVIGGLLANSSMTQEYWEFVAKNVNAFRNSKDHEGCLKILSLSYNNLPIHLKSCFLYMRVFPEDYEIRVSKLTKLWIAEGFLKPIRETCGIHDLLRDLCLREYETEHFIYVPKVQRVSVGCEKKDKCFVCGLGRALQRINLNEVHDASQLTSIASVLVCKTCRNMYPSLNKARLVRVRLVSKNGQSGESCEEEILHPTSLRYLEVKKISNLEFISPSTIALLWNQQTFTFLWCTDEVLERMPNLKKLGLSFSRVNGRMKWPYYRLYNLIRLQNLETLSVSARYLTLENITFPTSLKELRLVGCNIPWENMTTIGSLLPNLEKLELRYNTFKGREWNQVEGEFPRLKVLKISNSDDLKWWRAENICFPNLERLFLSWMWELEEIPLGIGDIPTLYLISLEGCKGSLYDSAKQMVEEQHDNGNESLQLYIDEERYQIGSSS
ncbi:UNVERIFIED_CONTAM: putative disease resistance RPP8-like protein 2 [Sesamum latifolium]|uniref:Disease resistance RPP8-like protein 2 n=1 Tax=Sesamum latifolium TaxID=2727402 RepID=A0AAW2UIA5_9LAMI